MYVKINNVEIPKKYGAKVSTSGGTGLYLSVSILGDQEIISKINSLEKRLYELESPDYTGIVKIEDIRPPNRVEFGDQFVTHFYFTMKRIP